jgi:hypothetical protein
MTANYVLLENIQLTQNAASVTFDNIPSSGYTDLKIVCSARGTQAAASNALTMRFNGATTNYSSRELVGGGSGTPASSTRTTLGSAMYVGNISGNSSTSNTFSNTEIYIPNYTSSSTHKSVSVDAVSENNATEAYATFLAGVWSDNAAITTIDLISLAAHGTLMAGSTFSLYGIAALGTNPSVGPSASGGNIVSTDGTYWYHTFLSSGAFTPAASLSIDYLVVAGGGAGGEGYSTRTGGGGAGGLRSTVGATGGGGSLESKPTLSGGTKYTITIGAGAVGGNGSNSSIAGTGLTTITSLGGGGGTQSAAQAGTGGSGGGAGWNNPGGVAGIGGAGTAGQGYGGGNSSTGSPFSAGGGGGAGAVGQTAPGSSTGGAGGAGVSISALATATGTGVSNFYAGGGGGGGSSAGAGGSGGGGAGSSGSIGTAGTINTGGGGGGQLGEGYSAKGGSGIVIIRYAV